MLTYYEKRTLEIGNALKLSENNPKLFSFLEENRNSLGSGDWAKIKLNCYHQTSMVSAYIWVEVQRKVGRFYTGKIHYSKSLIKFFNELGNTIDFSSEHIIQIALKENTINFV